jgi:hypothetical protein
MGMDSAEARVSFGSDSRISQESGGWDSGTESLSTGLSGEESLSCFGLSWFWWELWLEGNCG